MHLYKRHVWPSIFSLCYQHSNINDQHKWMPMHALNFIQSNLVRLTTKNDHRCVPLTRTQLMVSWSSFFYLFTWFVLPAQIHFILCVSMCFFESSWPWPLQRETIARVINAEIPIKRHQPRQQEYSAIQVQFYFVIFFFYKFIVHCGSVVCVCWCMWEREREREGRSQST